MSQTKKSIIFWFLASSLICGIIWVPQIYLNYWAEQIMRKAIIVPVFQAGAIAKAKTMRMEELVKLEAQEKTTEWERKLMDRYNLIFLFSSSTNEKKTKVFNRIKQNKKLAEALQYAKEHGVWVFVTDNNNFGVRSSAVDIPIRATDEEIITFLLGYSTKDKAGQ